MITEEEVERIVQRIMQCLDCIHNSRTCGNLEYRNGECIGFESIEEVTKNDGER